MGTSSRMTPPLVVAILLVATVALTDATPPYKCQEFFSSGNANRSHDKSGTEQHDDANCTGATCGAIEPKGDIIREVGDPFEAYCLFDSRYINASDVSFVYRGKRNDVPVEYQLPNYTIVNASAIKLNYISDRAEDFHLLCRIDSKSLCFRQVRIGYRPQEVKNFTCLSKNWSDLNCTWVAPYNPVQAQYHVMYVVPGFRFQSECPKRHHHANWCYFPPEEFGRIVKHYLIMRINATNVLAKEGVLFEYNVSLVETVVPEPVKDLKANVDGPSNITLTWQLPHPMDTFDKVLFEAAYRERFEGDVSENVPWHMVKQWKVAPQRFSPTEKFNITVNDLHAYTMHDFRVRMHTGFGDIRPHMWSEASILPERTAATYPTVAPKTTNGTFEVTETLSYREIYIFWQMVDQVYHNAPNFHYKINVFENESNRLIAKDDAEVDIKQSYAKFSNMEKDLTYRFEIIPMNDEGPPQNDNIKAIVMVPRKEDVLKQPTFFKVIAYSEPNNTVYSLKWRAEEAEAQGAETVTLFWCKKDKYEERCLNKLEWEIVDDPSLNVKNITHLEETSLYMFGISVNSQRFSTGIKWITCIASYGTQPPPLENFEVSEISSTKALLEWSLDCKAKAAEPIGFKISYCVAEDKDSKKCPADIERSYEEIRDETAVEYVVKDLHPYTNYIFNIAILTQIGPSKWSESINRKTEADKPSGPPQQFQVVESGQSWALLNWTPPLPTERNGEIVRYLVKYDSSYGLTEKVLNSEDAPPYNVTELEPYSNYKFQVTACTKMRLVGRSGSCGDVYAPLEMKTKIGAPSKVDDIFQMDEYVKWNHECSNGPACFYQLLYTINSTEYIYETELNAASINIKDLNITCTKDEKKIVVKLRAVTYNESNQKLFGSWKEEDITCFLTGSYHPNHVPSTSSDNLQIFLVQLPQNNQYNTIINLLKIPRNDNGFLSVNNNNIKKTSDHEHNPELQGLFKTNTKLGIQSSISSRGVSKPTFFVPPHVRHEDEHDSNGSGFGKVSRDTLVRDREDSSLEMSSEIDHTSDSYSWNFGGVLGDLHGVKVNSYVHKRVGHESSCPLLALMKTSGSKVRVSASNNRFEFNIKAAGSPYAILKALYQHSLQDNEPEMGVSSLDNKEVESVGGWLPTNDVIIFPQQIFEDSQSRIKEEDHKKVVYSNEEPSQSQQGKVLKNDQIGFQKLGVSEPQLVEKEGVITTLPPSVSKEDPGEVTVSLQSNASRTVELSKVPTKPLSIRVLDNRSTMSSSNGPLPVMEETPLPVLSGHTSDMGHGGLPDHLLVSGMQTERAQENTFSDARFVNIPILNRISKSEEDSADHNLGITTPSQYLPYSPSLIYRIIGSFNGNVGLNSQRIDSYEKNEFIVGVQDESTTHYDSNRPKKILNPFFLPQPVLVPKDSSGGSSMRNEIVQSEKIKNKPVCPFVNLLKSKGVSVKFSSPGDGQFEFNVQGNGNFYDLLEKLYDSSGSTTLGMKKIRGNVADHGINSIPEIYRDDPDAQFQQEANLSTKKERDINQEYTEVVTPLSMEVTSGQVPKRNSPRVLSESVHSGDSHSVQVLMGGIRNEPVSSTPQMTVPLDLVSETSTEEYDATKDKPAKMFVVIQ